MEKIQLDKLHWEIVVNAPVEKVWDTMLEDETYRIWTKAFNPEGSSWYEGGWGKGEKIKFVGVMEDGSSGGMTSEIAESRKYEFISVRHMGYILGGKEVFDSPEVLSWAPAYENYTYEKSGDDKTVLKIDMDSEPKYTEMFNDLWPKALGSLKTLCEKA